MFLNIISLQINKQSELITKKAATDAIIQKDHKSLKQMVESMQEKKMELEIKHAKVVPFIMT